MTLVYRHQKNEPLTIAEMDGNLAGLDQRLRALETCPVQAEGIAAFIQDGDHINVLGTSGTKLGQIVLPKMLPTPQGKWQAGVSYQVLDWVQAGNSVYSCKKPHESKDFDRDRELWALVFSLNGI